MVANTRCQADQRNRQFPCITPADLSLEAMFLSGDLTSLDALTKMRSAVPANMQRSWRN
jgi:hypothetical protein